MRTELFTGLKLGLLVLAIGCSGNTFAGSNHYRWLNERGEPVYSDRPPPKGTSYEVISSSSSFKRQVSGDEGAVPLETTPSPGNDFTAVDSSTEGRSEKNAALCERARANLEALTGESGKITVRNAQGEVRELSAEEKIIERQTAQAQVSVYCE